MHMDTMVRELNDEQLEQVVGGGLTNVVTNLNIVVAPQVNQIWGSTIGNGSSVGGNFIKQKNSNKQHARFSLLG